MWWFCSCCTVDNNEKEIFALEWVNSSSGTAQVRSYSSMLANEEMIMSDIRHNTDLDILYMKDFTRKRCVGSGACSDVFLLTRKKDQRMFAGKMYKPDIRALVNEANIIKSCSMSCTTIVNILGIIISPKCLVLEFYKNGSLDIALREDNLNMERGMETEFPFHRRLCYISDMCNAITHIHQKNICHRDIAMRNLLLSNDKTRILLSDFSLSRVINNSYDTQCTYTLLVPRDSAPETFSKRSDTSIGECRELSYGLKSDIWQLGIAMFEIIAKTEVELKASGKLPRTFPNKYLPPTTIFNRKWELWGWINRCMEELPKKRPQCWEVLEGIETLIANPYNTMKKGMSYINRVWTSPTSRYPNVANQLGETTEATLSNTVPYNVAYHRISEMSDFSSRSSISLQWSSENIILPETVSRGSNTERIKRSMLAIDKRNSKKQNTLHPRNECNRKFTWNSLSQFSASVKSDSSLLSRIFRLNSKRENLSAISPNSSWYKSDNLGVNVALTTTEDMELNTSWEEVSEMPNKFNHCSPLSFATTSEQTNIAHCYDRHFFTDRAKKLIAMEQIDNDGHLRESQSSSEFQSLSEKVDVSGNIGTYRSTLSFKF